MADTIINKEVNNKTLNNKWVMYLNIISFLLFLLVFYSLFSSIVSFISFIAYFVVLLIGGFGFILMLKKHNYEFSYLIILLISLLVGISLNIILFIFLDYLSIMGFVSLIILFVIGSISLILNNTKAFYVIKRIDIHKDILFTVGMFFLIFSIFLISDFSYYAEDGIYFKDDSHPIYEISISNGLGSMFPVYDMSYSGKIMKYHFGYPIIIHQLTNNFGVDPLTLVYKLIPAMFLFIFILFLIEVSRTIKNNYYRIIFMFAILFSSLNIHIDKLRYLIKALTNVAWPDIIFRITSIPQPPFFLHSITYMGSFGLAILFVVGLFFLIKEKKRNLLLEAIIITGIAMIKATFFVPIFVAYSLMYALEFIKDRDIKKVLKQSLVLAPGVMYLVIFVFGAHKQTLWVIFPGYLKSFTYLVPEYLIPSAILSFVIQVVLYFGIGLFCLYPLVRDLISSIFKKKLFVINSTTYFLSIIGVSYFFLLFFVELAELDQFQFIYPGCIILSLLAYTYILKHRFAKKFVIFLALFSLINFSLIGGIYYIAPSDKTYDLNYDPVNRVANVKLTLIKSSLDIVNIQLNNNHNIRKIVDFEGFFYPYDLINGLNELSHTNKNDVLLFSKLYETVENKPSSSWKSHGFIRSALSQKSALIEQHKYKSVLAEKDYKNRSLNNIYFYLIITGMEDRIEEVNMLFNNSGVPEYEDLIGYDYFRYFSTENFYTYTNDFFKFIYNNTQIVPLSEKQEKVEFLREYVIKNNVAYIMFEGAERPIKEYVELLDLHLFYESDTVLIYRVGNVI